MKKTIVAALALVFALVAIIPGYSAKAEVQNGQHDVDGKYNEGVRTDIYSVDVTWGSMRFEYVAADTAWDSTTHEWVATSTPTWRAENGTANQITVKNHSSKAVTVNLTANMNEGLGGMFSTSSFSLPVPSEGVDGAQSQTVTFMPTGAIDSTVTEYTKVGEVTVTIVGEDTPTIDMFTVKFVDFDGTVLKEMQVRRGESAVAPEAPSRDGFRFLKWDKLFDNVQSDLTVYAVYEELLNPTIYVGNVEAAPGETVQVPVYVKNNPGIGGMMVTISYDDTMLTITDSATTTLMTPIMTFTYPDRYVNPSIFLWDSAGDLVMGDGEFLLLTIKVSENAVAGQKFDISVSYRVGDIYGENFMDLDFDVLAGGITVK